MGGRESRIENSTSMTDHEQALSSKINDRSALVGIIGPGYVDPRLTWSGENLEETAAGLDGRTLVRVGANYFRPSEVGHFLSDASKARTRLGWGPKTCFQGLVEMMVDPDTEAL